MKRLVISIGSSLRGDDAVAHMAVELCRRAASGADVTFCQTHQLVPELAADFVGVDAAVFVDADASLEGPPSLQRLAEPPPVRGAATLAAGSLEHSFSPVRIVSLARRLYGFRGDAFVCRIPASAFDLSEEISGMAQQAAGVAAILLVRWVLDDTLAGPRVSPTGLGDSVHFE